MKGNTDQMEEEKKEYRPTVAFDAEGAPEPLSLANAVCHKGYDEREPIQVRVLPDRIEVLSHPGDVCPIGIEDLNVRGMVRNRHLSKTVSDAAFGEFVRQLTYKGQWYGVNVVKIDRWNPSSKTCSVCGHVKHDLKLHDREWTCVCCETHHDRDYNASVNIKSFGLAALPPDRREVKPADCPPVDDRRSKSGLRSSDRMKQEKFRGVTDAPGL